MKSWFGKSANGRRHARGARRELPASPQLQMSDFPEPLWMASIDDPEWAEPRRVRPCSFVSGPEAGREYLWLRVVAGDGDSLFRPAQDLVVTPRHHRLFGIPHEDAAVHVRLYLPEDHADLAAGAFRPDHQDGADAWTALWASYEAATSRAMGAGDEAAR